MNENLKKEVLEDFASKFPRKNFIPGESPVPVSGKIFDGNEMLLAVQAVLDGWWTDGKYTLEFEKKLANFLGLKYCAAVNSGSSANLVAITALTSFRLPVERRLVPGDEVITVAAGFPTTVNPIIQNELVPVFVDIELGTYNASLDKIKSAISEKTKAVFIAHTLGNPFDVMSLKKLCVERSLWLVEDNCDALGSKYADKYTGTYGDLCTSSFYPAHHITTAEGGAVMTDDPLLDKIVRSIRDWGRDCSCPTGVDNKCGKRYTQQFGELPYGYDHKYVYSEIGYNLKITDIQSALGIAQMDKLPVFIQKRKENFTYLYNGLKKYENFFILPQWEAEADPSWFGFLLTIRDGVFFKRDDLLKYLAVKKIGTRLLFGGNLTKQPYFLNYDIPHKIVGDLSNADKVMNDTFWIGCYPGLSQMHLDYIIESIDEFLN